MNTQIPKWMADEVAEYDLEISPPPKTILDIGANIGAFSLHYSKKWPEAVIRAYEPVAENFEALMNNVGTNRRIHAYNLAVRCFDGPDQIFLGDRGVTCGFHQLGRQSRNVEKVNCVNASQFPQADLVKIDTEGCEVEILNALDLKKTRAVVVEYHRPEDARSIMEICSAAGLPLLMHIPGSSTHGVLKFARDNGVRLPQKQSAALAPATRPKARRIYVAIAGHFSNHDLVFVQSMMGLVLRPPVMLQFGWSTDPSVERARNVLTANFLASDCTHILFIDADIGFSAEDVARVTSHDELVVGGMYPLKSMEPEVKWCGNGVKGKTAARADGLQEVSCIGTGFLCIAREAFEKVLETDVREIRYLQDWAPFREEFAFWRQGVREVDGKPRFLTEDWMFCYRWRDLGGKVFADTRVVLQHAGRAVWPLPLQKT